MRIDAGFVPPQDTSRVVEVYVDKKAGATYPSLRARFAGKRSHNCGCIGTLGPQGLVLTPALDPELGFALDTDGKLVIL